MENRTTDLTTPPPTWEQGESVEINPNAILLNLDLDAELAATLRAADQVILGPKSAWEGKQLLEIIGHRNRSGKLNFRCKFDGLGGPQGMWIPLSELLLVGEHLRQLANYLRVVQASKRANSWTALKAKFPQVEELAKIE